MADKLLSLGDGSSLIRLKDMGDGSYALSVAIGGLFAALAGERNAASALNSFLDVRMVGAPQILNASGSALAIGSSVAANDTHLIRIFIAAPLAGTLTIAGLHDHTGAAANFVLPIGFPAGSHEVGHGLNTAGALTMTLSSATDVGRIFVTSRPA